MADFNPIQNLHEEVSLQMIPHDPYDLHKGFKVAVQTPFGIAWTNFTEDFLAARYVILP
jgi:hypothetical protein